jgi:single-stranded DNA-specific DHH superfamily exonuclease
VSSVTEIQRGERPSFGSEPPPKSDVIVVSHRKDADGITSAALIHRLKRAKVILTDYGEMVETLEKVQGAREVFICDLGLNKSTFVGFLEQVKRIGSTSIVHYIDHHPIDPEFKKQLIDANVDLFHSTEECAAILVFQKFEQDLRLSPKMKVLACCGAITDYMDLQPYSKKLIASFDRQFLLYESTVLSFTIAMIGREGDTGNRSLVQIVEELSEKDKLPHEIDNASYYSQEFASHSADLIERARRDGKKLNNFAYYKTRESSTGNVANFLIGAFDVPVGLAFRDDGPDHFEISLRSTMDSKYDLGKIAGKISIALDASGGGHSHAAGARIRKDQLEEFIQMINKELM